jgi:hypothetical protein
LTGVLPRALALWSCLVPFLYSLTVRSDPLHFSFCSLTINVTVSLAGVPASLSCLPRVPLYFACLLGSLPSIGLSTPALALWLPTCALTLQPCLDPLPPSLL